MTLYAASPVLTALRRAALVDVVVTTQRVHVGGGRVQLWFCLRRSFTRFKIVCKSLAFDFATLRS